MNQSKHTPGPWSCDMKREGDRAFPFMINCPDGDPLARVIASGDARLIAAAPELLEALKTILADIESGSGLKDAIDEARAIIAKAESN